MFNYKVKYLVYKKKYLETKSELDQNHFIKKSITAGATNVVNYELTNFIIYRIGRALVFTLEDLEIPGDKENKYVTILFSEKGFNDWYKDRLQIFVNNNLNTKKLSFTLEKWGDHSDLINGELNTFISYLREKWPKYDPKRPVHVATRK